MPKRKLGVNEAGLRVGEDHPRAMLTDHDVELIRQLADGGMLYRDIARKFDISKFTVGRICRFERRGQTVHHYIEEHNDG